MICDKKVAAEVKGKVYKREDRPAMLFGFEMVALTKRQEAELELATLMMLENWREKSSDQFKFGIIPCRDRLM